MQKILIVLVAGLCLLNCSRRKQNIQAENSLPASTVSAVPESAAPETTVVDSTKSSVSAISMAETDSVAIVVEEGVYLLEPTQYHGDEVKPEWESLPWYGLFRINEAKFELRPTKVSFVQVHDGIVDNEGEKTGWQIKVLDPDTLPLFVVGGRLSLRQQAVRGQSHEYRILPPDSILVLDPNYRLRALGTIRRMDGETGERAFEHYGLELIGNNMRQKLFTHYQFVGDGPSVVWQGYLDADTIPDLLINCTTHYNASILVLFLSTQAQAGQIVKPVARMHSVGC